MRSSWLIESAVFAAGIAIGVACANDSGAQAMERIVPDDTTAVMRLVRVVRGANPLVCEMMVRTADMRGSWMNRGSVGSSALVVDSAASALLDWVQRSHNDPALVPPLSAAIRDDDPCVRRVAGSLLAHVSHRAAVDALRDALADANAGTREAAALGLGMSEARDAIDPLMSRLHDESAPVRGAAAWALGELEARKALPGLIDLLAKDADPHVRQAAAWAIGNIH